MDKVFNILMENSKSFADRKKLNSLTPNERNSISNVMISNLYKAAIDKSHIDFGDIPRSKGSLRKYEGYKQMESTISILTEMMDVHKIQIPELEIVTDAVNNIIRFEDAFEKGFALNKEFIILQYNTLVYACIQALSLIVSSYVDFIKKPSTIEFVMVNESMGAKLLLDNLDEFNKSVKGGDFAKAMNAVINTGKEGFVGIEAVAITAAILAAIVLIVPITRELIFYYYNSRMKVSDYLNQQALLLEIHKNNINNSTRFSPAKKSKILKEQEKRIQQLNKMSDAIKINSMASEGKANKEIKDQNKKWNVDSVQNQSANDSIGFKML